MPKGGAVLRDVVRFRHVPGASGRVSVDRLLVAPGSKALFVYRRGRNEAPAGREPHDGG
ncbi:MAG: hypothetical protein U5Q44_03135 [Dehalococcoidia bacterium]|nr:hypothetical protein [Dehalococcoidia bacterium]